MVNFFHGTVVFWGGERQERERKIRNRGTARVGASVKCVCSLKIAGLRSFGCFSADIGGLMSRVEYNRPA